MIAESLKTVSSVRNEAEYEEDPRYSATTHDLV
jgi:hypothetical protein